MRGLLVAVSIAVLGAAAALVAAPAASAGLPPGWAYELMTEGDKAGAPVDQSFRGDVHALSPDGDHGAVVTPKAFAGGAVGGSANPFGIGRGAAGWSFHGLMPKPPIGTPLPLTIFGAGDFDVHYRRQVFTNPLPFVAEDTGTAHDVYIGNAFGVEWVSQPRVGTASALYSGMSADARHILFRSADRLLAVDQDRVVGTGLYDRTGGETVAVGVDDAGELLNPCGAELAGTGGANDVGTPRGANSVSDDGSIAFFTTGSGATPGCSVQTDEAGQIYARIGNERTVLVSPTRRSVPEATRLVPVFRMATPDGSRAFFTSSEQLTDAEPAGVSGSRLYRFDLPAPGDPNGTLTDLTPVAFDAAGDPTTADPGVLGSSSVRAVAGTSDDGRRVYFLATGQLTRDAPAGGEKLYLSDDGELRYVASPNLQHPVDRWFRISPDGSKLAFVTATNLAGYSHGTTRQVYVWDADVGGPPRCVSCPASPPTGDATLGPASAVPSMRLERRAISDDGRVFFDTPDALVAEDANGQIDTYMDEPGLGGPVLISTGRSAVRSPFIGASRDGTTVAFETYDTLVPQDRDRGVGDMYVARLGGGFPYSPPVPCEADACQGPGAPPPAGAGIGSATLAGARNAAERRVATRRAKVARRGVAVKGRARLRLRLPAAGVIAVSSPALRSTARRRVGRSGAYRVKAVLRRGARSALRRRGRVRIAVRVRFSPRAGRGSVTRARVTLRTPATKGRGRS